VVSDTTKAVGGCLGMIGIICCVGVGGCAFMVFLASRVKITTTGTSADKAIVKTTENPTWSHITTKDPLTDEQIQTSLLQSTNKVELKFPYMFEQRGTLTLQKHGEETDVMFSIARGQLFPTSLPLGTGTASVRIDDVMIQSPIAPTTGMKTETMFLTDKQLPDLIMKGRELRIEVELFQESNQVFVFDLTSGR